MNAGLTFAVANELPYIFPALEPEGHESGAAFADFFDRSLVLVHDAAAPRNDDPAHRRHRLVDYYHEAESAAAARKLVNPRMLLPELKLMLRCPSRVKNFEYRKAPWVAFGCVSVFICLYFFLYLYADNNDYDYDSSSGYYYYYY